MRGNLFIGLGRWADLKVQLEVARSMTCETPLTSNGRQTASTRSYRMSVSEQYEVMVFDEA